MAFVPISQRARRQVPGALNRQHPFLRDLLQGVVAGPLRDATDIYKLTSCTAVRGITVVGDVVEYTGSGGRATAPTIADSSPWTMISYGIRRSSVGFSSVATVAESPGNATVDRSLGINAAGTVQAALYDGNNRIVTTTAAIPVDEPRIVAAVASGLTLRAYAGGELASVATTNAGYTAYSTPELVLGYGQMTNSTAASYWSAAYTLLIRRALSLDELLAWERDPSLIYAPRRLLIPVVSGAGPTPVGMSTEVDTAQALTARVIGAAGLSTEIDSTLALTGKQILAVGLSSETDTSFALSARQIRAAGTSTEVDTAIALTGKQIRVAGLATETNSALALVARVLAPVGMAIEVDRAFALAAAVPGAVGTAVEIDTAYALAGKSILAVGLAAETDNALALTSRSIRAVGLATEVNSAFALTGKQTLAVGMASEVNTAFALAAGSGGTALPVGLSVEVDTAYALSARIIRQVGMAIEVDRAFALSDGTLTPSLPENLTVTLRSSITLSATVASPVLDLRVAVRAMTRLL